MRTRWRLVKASMWGLPAHVRHRRRVTSFITHGHGWQRRMEKMIKRFMYDGPSYGPPNGYLWARARAWGGFARMTKRFKRRGRRRAPAVLMAGYPLRRTKDGLWPVRSCAVYDAKRWMPRT